MEITNSNLILGGLIVAALIVFAHLVPLFLKLIGAVLFAALTLVIWVVAAVIAVLANLAMLPWKLAVALSPRSCFLRATTVKGAERSLRFMTKRGLEKTSLHGHLDMPTAFLHYKELREMRTNYESKCDREQAIRFFGAASYDDAAAAWNKVIEKHYENMRKCHAAGREVDNDGIAWEMAKVEILEQRINEVGGRLCGLAALKFRQQHPEISDCRAKAIFS